jgi:hypothetical protein
MRNTTTIMNAKCRVGQSTLVLALTGNPATYHLTHRPQLSESLPCYLQPANGVGDPDDWRFG